MYQSIPLRTHPSRQPLARYGRRLEYARTGHDLNCRYQ
ncbi:hypothetical protein D030_3460A, partial [Vibrio parahaemolyticus AQ3810]